MCSCQRWEPQTTTRPLKTAAAPPKLHHVRADLTVRGHTASMSVRANVQVLDDGAVRVTTQTTVNRKGWGVTGDMLGMVGDKTALWADLVFQRAAS